MICISNILSTLFVFIFVGFSTTFRANFLLSLCRFSVSCKNFIPPVQKWQALFVQGVKKELIMVWFLSLELLFLLMFDGELVWRVPHNFIFY